MPKKKLPAPENYPDVSRKALRVGRWVTFVHEVYGTLEGKIIHKAYRGTALWIKVKVFNPDGSVRMIATGPEHDYTIKERR